MSDGIGYASYQQQYNTTLTGNDAQSSNTASIALFFSIIVCLVLSFGIYFWYTEKHKVPIIQRGDQKVGQQQEIYMLVDNISTQVRTIFKIPIITLSIVLWKRIIHKNTSTLKEPESITALPVTGASVMPDANDSLVQPMVSYEHQRVYRTSIYHLCSLLFIITFVISLSMLVATVSSADSSSKNSPLLTQTALFIFVVSINLYLIARQRCYYMERRKLFGKTDEHINAVYETRFSNWDKSMLSNWIQIMILIIEFFQLMTFPLRDLINVTRTSQSQAHSSQLTSLILNTGSLMPDMRTPTWYRYSLWTTFTTMMCSLLLGLSIHAINFKFPYKISTRWVRWCIPVATLLYIPVLTTFVSSAACQSLNVSSNDYSLTLRCNSATISRPLYFWLSLFGYIVAYVLLTVFLTSYERVPNKNEIAFKSISVAFIKNMGLLLAIVFLLVESTTNINRMRAILSITILLTMICYNIKTQPCYVDKINFFRTISFACILWTSTLVAVLSDTNAAQSLGPAAVIYIIIGGWVFIILCFFAIYFVYYIQPPDRSAIESSSALHSRNTLSQAAHTTCSGDNHNQKNNDTQFQFARIFSKWILPTNASKQNNDTQRNDRTDMHIRY